MVTTIEKLAGWTADLRLEDVPGAVVDLCRAQRRSVFAAMCARPETPPHSACLRELEPGPVLAR